MIYILADDSAQVPIADGNVLESISEFPAYFAQCLDCLDSHQDLKIYVRPRAVVQWFRNMASRYPQGAFVFETIGAREVLAQRWQVSIPTAVSNEEIVQAKLLSLDLQPQPGQSFEDVLLGHFYAPILAAKNFPFVQPAQLLSVVDVDKWKANATVPLLARTLHSRLEEWKSKARTAEQKQLVELFAANPVDLKRQLMQFRVLRSYPTIGEAILGNAYTLFTVLKLSLQDLAVDGALIAETVLQVTYHLNSLQPQSAQELMALIESVSGLLLVEFDTIEKHLLAHPEWISPDLLERVETKFEYLSRPLAQRLATLRRQIRPPKPGFPDSNWNFEQMLTWATGSYLPYQAWCSAHGQFDPDLYAIGDCFSEWLVSNWGDLHANSKRMVFNVLPNKTVEFKDPRHVNLVLVVDNLAWSFSAMLRDLFQERGYFLTTAEPYLAMLPTETEISKKCLLSGAVGYTQIDDKTYKGIIEKGWVPYFNDSAFRYVSDIGNLGKIDKIDSSAYVVNYLAIDKALHASANVFGMPHREHVDHLLSRLVEDVHAFVERHDLHDKIRIHVVSDHGSTRIPASAQNDLDPGFFKSQGFEERAQRFVEVSNERFTTLPDNLKLDCFFLPANDYLNPANVLCARRANRFLSIDQDVYVHGGLLPEEVIVPYMAFEPATVPLQDLTVLLKKNEFRYRMETIELEVGNPNEAAVVQVRVSVLNSNVESEPFEIAFLNGKTKRAIQIRARFKLTSLAEEQVTLRLRVRFRARGEIHSFDAQPAIIMRKMVEEKSTNVFDV